MSRVPGRKSSEVAGYGVVDTVGLLESRTGSRFGWAEDSGTASSASSASKHTQSKQIYEYEKREIKEFITKGIASVIFFTFLSNKSLYSPVDIAIFRPKRLFFFM